VNAAGPEILAEIQAQQGGGVGARIKGWFRRKR
jgi:hypothetical protein